MLIFLFIYFIIIIFNYNYKPFFFYFFITFVTEMWTEDKATIKYNLKISLKYTNQ